MAVNAFYSHYGHMMINENIQPCGKSSWSCTIAALVPFILLNFAVIGSELYHWVQVPNWILQIANNTASFVISISFFALVIGWTKCFPRWSYPYVGYAFVSSLLLSIYQPIRWGIFGFLPIEGEIWRWTAWIPFVISLLICICVKPSLVPFYRLLINAWEDWTIISFTLFSFVPFLFGAGIEQAPYVPYHSTELFRDIFILIVTSLSIFYYMRAKNHMRQTISLCIGIVTIVLAVLLDEALYSQINEMVDLKIAISHAMIFLGLIFSPALVGVIHKIYYLKR